MSPLFYYFSYGGADYTEITTLIFQWGRCRRGAGYRNQRTLMRPSMKLSRVRLWRRPPRRRVRPTSSGTRLPFRVKAVRIEWCPLLRVRTSRCAPSRLLPLLRATLVYPPLPRLRRSIRLCVPKFSTLVRTGPSLLVAILSLESKAPTS